MPQKLIRIFGSDEWGLLAYSRRDVHIILRAQEPHDTPLWNCVDNVSTYVGISYFLGLNGDKNMYDLTHVFRVPALYVPSELMGCANL